MRQSVQVLAIFFGLCLILESVVSSPVETPQPVPITPGIHNVPPSENEVIREGLAGVINTKLIKKGIEQMRPIMKSEMIKEYNNIKDYLAEPVPKFVRGALQDILTLQSSVPPAQIPESHNAVIRTLKARYNDLISVIKSTMKTDEITYRGIDHMVNATIRGITNYFYIKRKKPQVVNGDIDGVPPDAIVVIDEDGDGVSEEVLFDVPDSDTASFKSARNRGTSDGSFHTVRSSPSTSSLRSLDSHGLDRHSKRGLWSSLQSWSALRQYYNERIDKLIRSITREMNVAIHDILSETIQNVTEAIPPVIRSALTRYIPAEYLEPQAPPQSKSQTTSPVAAPAESNSWWSYVVNKFKSLWRGPRSSSRSSPQEVQPQQESQMNRIWRMFADFSKKIEDNIAEFVRIRMKSLEDTYKDIAATIVKEQVYLMVPLSRH
ncbi:hypothetical protein BKA69DRAFT_1126393 [Paraphysoderma sedebokerense]|nr:hypothetical protein BKA69DRAFT_1126393 [Paraphysoderma sedebokerense]